MSSSRTVFTLGLLVAACSFASGQGPIQRESVEQLVAPYLDSQTITGLSVGVIVGERRASFGFGQLSPDNATAPNGQTIYEIGSITKVFTGILLADAVNRKQVRLDQAIQEVLPSDVQLQVKDQPITFLHLATHTSGLPRIPDNMRPADTTNPYADYSLEHFYDFLNKYTPASGPGIKSSYSNLGMGLLGHLMATEADMSYEALLKQCITEPLEMNDTAITLTADMKQRLAQPLHADGTPAANWDLPTLAGAGAIRSTTDDMLSFVAAQLEPPADELGQALQLAWKPHWKPEEAGQFTLGLGWHVAHDGQTRWHNGGTGGYHSMMLVNRQNQIGTILLCNTATGEIDRLAEDIVKMLAGMPVKPRVFAPEPETVEVPVEVLRRYEGRFAIVPEFVLTVTVKGGSLYVQATGQPAFPVFAKSETEWFYKVVDAQLTFKVDDDGVCNTVILHQNGRDMPAQRLAEE